MTLLIQIWKRLFKQLEPSVRRIASVGANSCNPPAEKLPWRPHYGDLLSKLHIAYLAGQRAEAEGSQDSYNIWVSLLADVHDLIQDATSFPGKRMRSRRDYRREWLDSPNDSRSMVCYFDRHDCCKDECCDCECHPGSVKEY